MKKVSLIVVVAIILIIWACEKEQILKEESVVVENNDSEEPETKKGWGQTCFYYIEYGLKWGGHCHSSFPGICEYKRICIPEIYFEPCQLIPCWPDIFDPRIIYEKIDPRVFISLREKLQLDIDSRHGAVPFAMNEGILGLQFYEENRLLSSDGKILLLKQDLVLDIETTKELGLRGNVLKAGEYPVVFNKENKTFNAILNVEKGFERVSE
ncbi:hypothetical protein [Aquimarina sp. RZ0]|uniref:hypothetical protein n=1 Tax=Aquimarina sp. RZ0 TaxID=2607730 RepID=UPI0011F1F75A|nr:hypothetical protein [Aquimarina sp. RZ0]KAA1247621.1 hypothetical protein F0000_02100 [Aquimarina sp. RZ0]